MPPWTSLVDLLLVLLAKSCFSTSATLYPRATASSATPAPVTPPPITRTSKGSLSRRDRLCWRTVDDSGCIMVVKRRMEVGRERMGNCLHSHALFVLLIRLFFLSCIYERLLKRTLYSRFAYGFSGSDSITRACQPFSGKHFADG